MPGYQLIHHRTSEVKKWVLGWGFLEVSQADPNMELEWRTTGHSGFSMWTISGSQRLKILWNPESHLHRIILVFPYSLFKRNIFFFKFCIWASRENRTYGDNVNAEKVQSENIPWLRAQECPGDTWAKVLSGNDVASLLFLLAIWSVCDMVSVPSPK